MIDILNTYWLLIPITFSQSLIYAFVALGIMLPFRVLGFPDLTSEGAFPLGGCVCGAMIAAGYDPVAAMSMAVVAGFLAGCSTALIHLRFGINTLLAGILVLTMLYSVNLRIMGRSNIALFSFDNIFSQIHPELMLNLGWKVLFIGSIVLLLCCLLYLFFITEKGIAVRAVGANPEMAEAQGISIWAATIGGVGLASAFSALGGSLLIQSQGYADVGMGFGVLINGLAALIIGEAFLGRGSVLKQLMAPVLGALVYYQLVSLILAFGLPPSDLKFATGAFVLIMLAAPSVRGVGSNNLRKEKIRE